MFYPRCRTAFVVALAFGLPLLAEDAPHGLSNFYQVNDHIYRGGQPSDEGFKSLAKLGVKTILDLRESGDRSASESAEVTSLGMHYVNIPLAGFAAPSAEQVSKVLALFSDSSAGPVFVHCRRGADRTGTMIALYRIEHDHWDNGKALDEAKSFKMARWEIRMKSYVLHYHPKVIEAAASGQSSALATQ